MSLEQKMLTTMGFSVVRAVNVTKELVVLLYIVFGTYRRRKSESSSVLFHVNKERN